MSLMFEKKARELLDLYMKAELAGEDEKAQAYEDQLNKGGWYITVGPDGTTVRKKSQDGGGSLGDSLWLPQDSNISPYRGSSNADMNQGARTRSILIAVGIGIGVLGLIALIVYISKKKKLKNAGLQQG